jgi:6-phosphogluconate dehydrogenase
MGADGAGHFVKMVHNGIEYADMQLIAEAYLLLKYAGGCSNQEIGRIFRQWNEGELKSFLIGITADIFAEPDEAGGELLDKIVDSAGQKGTGRWTSIEALRQGVNTSLITAACNARVMSNLLEERQEIAPLVQAEGQGRPGEDFVEMVLKSLYLGKIAAYAQGFALYSSAAREYGWQLELGRIAAIFRSGCIIQAEFLNRITEAYEKDRGLRNLLLDDFFAGKVRENLSSLRQTVSCAVLRGIPIPALSCAAEYLDALGGGHLGANLIQAQRDYFGAHTFKRVYREGTFHHEWQKHD